MVTVGVDTCPDPGSIILILDIFSVVTTALAIVFTPDAGSLTMMRGTYSYWVVPSNVASTTLTLMVPEAVLSVTAAPPKVVLIVNCVAEETAFT